MARDSRHPAPPGAWRQADDEELTPILSPRGTFSTRSASTARPSGDIAGRVGVTVPALYYHHANKEAILTALLDRSISSVIERCEQALGEGGR